MLNGHVFVPIIANARPDDSENWPVVIFSHGLGCCRTTYSRICYDLASYGFIVAAPEHRDGSACASFYEQDANRQNDQRIWIQHRTVERNQDEYEIRHGQVKFRANEVSRTLDILTAIKGGQLPVNTRTDCDPEVLRSLGSIMNLEKPVICGKNDKIYTVIEFE